MKGPSRFPSLRCADLGVGGGGGIRAGGGSRATKVSLTQTGAASANLRELTTVAPGTP